MLTNLLTDELTATRDLFVDLLGFRVEFEADWFISMVNGDGDKVSAMSRSSEYIPTAYQQSAQGVMVTIVVDDVEAVFAKAKRLNLDIIEAPRNLPYGQRRLLIADCSGALIDVSSPTAPVDAAYRS